MIIKDIFGHYFSEGETLSDAISRVKDLWCVDLENMNLQNIDLRKKSLANAKLKGTNLEGALLPNFQIPQNKDLTVYKRTEHAIVTLKIPKEAKRTACLVNNKCRAEFADVLSIENVKTSVKMASDRSIFHYFFVYETGKRVFSDSYCDDIRISCSNGIHFFMTEVEARDFK